MATGEWEISDLTQFELEKKEIQEDRRNLPIISYIVASGRASQSSHLPLPCLYSPPLPYLGLSAIHECDQLLCLSIGA